MIMLITLLNDGALISIGYDNVVANPVRRLWINMGVRYADPQRISLTSRQYTAVFFWEYTNC